ncbi:MAG: DcaP family trimeric outer membrane transporter [Terriglobia bacterium]
MILRTPLIQIRAKWISLLLIVAQIFIAQSAWTQSQDATKEIPDVQQLKSKLLQLEQAMQDLKGQIEKVEQAQKTVSATPPAAPPAPAPTVETAAKKTDKPASAPKSKAENTLQFYGFVMMDSGYDFKTNNPDWFDVIRPTKLPAYDGEFAPDGKFYYGVRQTRFGVKSSTDTRYGDLKTIFEFELFGTGVDAGQTTFRLRHAYGELGHFGAGQTWSPFMDIDVFPNSLEYWGPNGMVFFRNVQFRWMPIKSEKGRITIAIERPGASADQGIYQDRIELTGVRGQFNMPDISWDARLNKGWGYVQAAGIFRKISWVDTLKDAYDFSGTAYGYGINLTSNVKFGKKSIGRFAFVYGQGIENYMNDAPVDVAIQNNFSDPVRPIKGVALPVMGIVSFVDHNWSRKFSTSLGYSMLNVQNSNGQEPSAFHQGHYALSNLLFYPVENVMLGGEFQFGRRLNYLDGFNVNDYRVQFSFRYNWSKTFGY